MAETGERENIEYAVGCVRRKRVTLAAETDGIRTAHVKNEGGCRIHSSDHVNSSLATG